MALPPSVRVKLSSEAAEAISITPVVIRELSIRELVEQILGVTGKDQERVADLLLHGTLVSGASRFRWQGWTADPDALRDLLATFPDPDPARAFAAERCVRAVLRGGRLAIELPRDAMARKSLFQRATFWDALLAVVAEGSATYAGYSYRERCDRYLREFSHDEAERLRGAAGAIAYTTLRQRVLTVAFTRAELHVTR